MSYEIDPSHVLRLPTKRVMLFLGAGIPIFLVCHTEATYRVRR